MRHHNHNRKLGRDRDERASLLRGLAVSLIRDGKITTTEAKAKELRPLIEKHVTRGRTKTLAARRILTERLGSTAAQKRLVDEIAPRYKERPGGYTRITKIGSRAGDAGKMAVIEFV